jgi:uncharacterized pyridoxamine 5'-phosphate oxidase family protein
MGVKKFRTIPRSDKELVKVEGIIKDYGMKNIYDKDVNADVEIFYVKIKELEFYSILGKHKQILKKEIPIKLKKQTM